jgi:hypothetical protein
VSIAEFTGSLDVAVSLAAASDSLNPLSLDVHCPRLIRTLLALPAVWTYGATRLSSSPTNFTADAGGDAFTAIAWDPSRSVPIVAVSDEYGAVLFPEIVEAMANDLAGLALVARLDPGASWRITRRKGKEWSCYGGAIRLYWPQIKEGANHGDHPLWTARRLLTGVADTETAAGRIRSQLRRRILGQSAFAVTEAPIFAAIRRAARTEELTALQAKANADTDYRALAEAYSGEMDKLQEELERAEAEKVALREQVQELQLALRWKDQEANSVEPDLETPPSTVEEAVLTAMDTFDKYLVFGNSVDTGSSVRLFW